MAGMGLTAVEIAMLQGVTVKTLRKYCGEELREAAPKANAAVALALYKQATGTDGQKPNAIAAMFWLKARAGWVEAEKLLGREADKGKKEHRQDAARKVASSGKFKPSAPPRLAAVNGETVPPPPPKPEKP